MKVGICFCLDSVPIANQCCMKIVAISNWIEGKDQWVGNKVELLSSGLLPLQISISSNEIPPGLDFFVKVSVTCNWNDSILFTYL